MAPVSGAQERILAATGSFPALCLIGVMCGHPKAISLAVMFIASMVGWLWVYREYRREQDRLRFRADGRVKMEQLEGDFKAALIRFELNETKTKRLSEEVAALIQADTLRKGFR